MVRTAVQKIADVLIFLCGFLIFCDILLLPLTPALAYFRFQNPVHALRPPPGCFRLRL